MIVVEERLQELFSQIPEIQLNSNNSNKPFFGWGKKEELNRYILNTDEKVLYPLIWLLPSEDTQNILSEYATRQAVFILATRETRDELYNPQRYQGSYKNILNPLTSYVIQALQNSSITRIINLDEIKVFKEPNYSDQEKNATIDEWDTVRIECNVEINNNCLNTLKWK